MRTGESLRTQEGAAYGLWKIGDEAAHTAIADGAREGLIRQRTAESMLNPAAARTGLP